MIDKISGTYILICDICGEEPGEIFDEFYDAVKYKKENGWKSRKIKDEWQDICPNCQYQENKNKK